MGITVFQSSPSDSGVHPRLITSVVAQRFLHPNVHMDDLEV